MLTPQFKFGTTIPTYSSGGARIYEIKQANERHYPLEYLKDTGKEMPFKMLSISDRLRYEFEARKKKITIKIRVPQPHEIDTLSVLRIGSEFHKVFNVYDFTNKEGFLETDITLEEYPNPRMEADL